MITIWLVVVVKSSNVSRVSLVVIQLRSYDSGEARLAEASVSSFVTSTTTSAVVDS